MILKITKAAPRLSSKIVEYLDKEKNEINQSLVEAHKLKARIKKDPGNLMLSEDYRKNSESVKRKTQEWEKREGSGFRISGFLRAELMASGYKELRKEKQFDAVLKLWNAKLDSQKRKENHIGVRRLILSPDPKDLDGLTDDEKKTVLEKAVDDAMHKFRERYFDKGDQISYLSAVHLDTKTAHTHIYIFPYSKNGHYVSMNADRYLRKDVAAKLGVDRLRAKLASENKLDKLTVMATNSFIKERNRVLSKKLLDIPVQMPDFKEKLEKIRQYKQKTGQVASRKLVRQLSGEDAYIKTWDEVWR